MILAVGPGLRRDDGMLLFQFNNFPASRNDAAILVRAIAL
jgi:hypothetical protein